MAGPFDGDQGAAMAGRRGWRASRPGTHDLIRPARHAVGFAALLYAVAAMLLGIAHHAPPAARSNAGLAALLATGGLLPSGCGDPSGDPDGADRVTPCGACLLLHGSAPPPATVVVVPPAMWRATPRAAVAGAAPCADTRRTRPPSRAPPVLA
jgi:hypothetical protein